MCTVWMRVKDQRVAVRPQRGCVVAVLCVMCAVALTSPSIAALPALTTTTFSVWDHLPMNPVIRLMMHSG